MQKMKTHKFDFSKNIELDFAGGQLSSDAGLLLVHEFCEKFGVLDLLKELLPENRDGHFKHEKPEILYQQLIRIIAGYPSNNFAKQLQYDPIFKKIHDAIASSPTCTRLEQTFSIEDLKSFQRLQTRLIDLSYKIEKPQEVHLDLDTTYDPASDNMEGATYNTHYGETGFSPLFCVDGKTGYPIKAHLRPGNTHCSKKVVPFMKPLLKRYKKLGIKVRSRLDSAFASPKIYDMYEENNALYYIKLRRNAVLKQAVQDLLTEDELKERKEIFTEISYRAKSWKKERRVLLHIHWPDGKLFPEYAAIVTNDEEIEPEKGIKFYRGRAKIEKSIEESKNGFSSDHLSHNSFVSNMVKFQIFVTAQLIINLFRRTTFPGNKQASTITTIRLTLLKIAARMVKNSHSFIFKCASCCPFKDFFISVLNNIQALPRFG